MNWLFPSEGDNSDIPLITYRTNDEEDSGVSTLAFVESTIEIVISQKHRNKFNYKIIVAFICNLIFDEAYPVIDFLFRVFNKLPFIS